MDLKIVAREVRSVRIMLLKSISTRYKTHIDIVLTRGSLVISISTSSVFEVRLRAGVPSNKGGCWRCHRHFVAEIVESDENPPRQKMAHQKKLGNLGAKHLSSAASTPRQPNVSHSST